MINDTNSGYFKANTDNLDTIAPSNSQQSEIHYGSMLILLKDRFGQPFLVIGPHWYVSMIGFGLIALVGFAIVVPLWPVLGAVLKILFGFMLGFALTMYIVMFLSNPGIIPQKISRSIANDAENKNDYSCLKCWAPKSKKAQHCDDCDVCIEQHDHHCVWVGKCVGGRNLMLFYVFVASIPIFFVFVMFMSIIIGFDRDKK